MKLTFNILLVVLKLIITYSLGINIGIGQISNSLLNDDIWLSWIKTNNITSDIKYFWRDTNQLDKQFITYNSMQNTSAIIAIQNHELPLSIEAGLSIVNSFQKYSNIIKAFTVGNELDSKLDPYQFNTNVINSIKNLNIAMNRQNVSISITTPLTMSILGWEEMTLQNEWEETLLNLLDFYNQTNSYVMFNIYPYLSWLYHKDLYTLDYALTDMFSDKINQIYKIFEFYGFHNLKLIIGETGWPTEGNDGATKNNAYLYWQTIYNLPYDIYWFELIDEDLKPGSNEEHYYGLFTKNGKIKFDLSM